MQASMKGALVVIGLLGRRFLCAVRPNSSVREAPPFHGARQLQSVGVLKQPPVSGRSRLAVGLPA
jgi:hypothetical protein